MYHSIYKAQPYKLNALNRTEEKNVHALIGEVVSDIHYLMRKYQLEPKDDNILRDVLYEMANDGFFDCVSSSTKFKKIEYIISGMERKYARSGNSAFN